MNVLRSGYILTCLFWICDTGSTNDLPPVHAMNDFRKCKTKGDIFCRIQFTLRPNSYNNKAWQIIQARNEKPDCLNRDVIYRFRCFSENLENGMERIKETATRNENELLQNFSLTASIDDIDCSNYSKEIALTSYDYIILYSTLAWLAFITLATAHDAFSRVIFSRKVSPFMKSLSVLHNWEVLRKPIHNEDYRRLVSVQGIRTMNIALVIVGHSLYHAIIAFVADTDFVEDFYRNGFMKYMMNLGLHIVQTNFLISGWMLANQLHLYLEEHKQLTIRISLKIIVYRYLRLIPALAFLILWESSNWTRVTGGPPLERSEMDFRACQKNWWATLLMVNNYLLSYDMCNLGTWYIANDFQMFVLAVLLFYIMTNFDNFEWIIIWILGLCCFIHAGYIYINDLGVMFYFSPENSKVENSVASPILNILYTSFYGNYSAHAIGLIFGGLYYKYKNIMIKGTEKIFYHWLLVFLSLPLGAVYVSMFQFPRLSSAIIGAALKPIFTLGIAVGIFGMSHGIGGIIKEICESRFLVFLSRWTYSIYIIHFPIVFSRYAMMNEPVEMSPKIMITSLTSDLLISFVAGLVLYLVIERPCINILKKLMKESPNDIKKE